MDYSSRVVNQDIFDVDDISRIQSIKTINSLDVCFIIIKIFTS